MSSIPLIVELQESVVYQVDKHPSKSSDISIDISGTGSVNIKGSSTRPTSLNDAILKVIDSNLTEQFYIFDQNVFPQYIKIEQNQAGSRTIIATGLVFTNLNLS